MKKAVSSLVIADLLFVALLALSGSLEGLFSELVYYLAFILPAVFLLIYIRLEKEGVTPLKIGVSKESALLSLPILFLTLAAVFLISFLTSFVLSFVGKAPTTDLSGNIFAVILIHAVLPSLLEEGLFRYIPLMILSPHSKRSAVIISALFFALIHCSIYQLPYALVAGIVFAALDLAAGSILPSVILHFLNNLVSIIWARNSGNSTFVFAFIIILSLLAVVSLIPVLIYRGKYKNFVNDIFEDKSKEKLSFEPIILAAVTLFVAFLSL